MYWTYISVCTCCFVSFVQCLAWMATANQHRRRQKNKAHIMENNSVEEGSRRPYSVLQFEDAFRMYVRMKINWCIYEHVFVHMCISTCNSLPPFVFLFSCIALYTCSFWNHFLNICYSMSILIMGPTSMNVHISSWIWMRVPPFVVDKNNCNLLRRLLQTPGEEIGYKISSMCVSSKG